MPVLSGTVPGRRPIGCGDLFERGAEMSTSVQTTHTSIGFIVRTILNDDGVVLALFCVLGLLASAYVMTHFAVEGSLAAWL